jgi:hypothetical protein
LLISGFWQRNPVKIFAALDAMQPPVAILAALCVAIAGFIYFVPTEITFFNILGYLPLALVTAYGIIVVVRGRHEGIGLGTVIWAPIYVLWRCSSFVLAWVFLDRIRFGRREKPVTELATTNAQARSAGDAR